MGTCSNQWKLYSYREVKLAYIGLVQVAEGSLDRFV